MATVRFTDTTKDRKYEFEVEGKEARALSKIYEHLTRYPAEAVGVVIKVVPDPEVADAAGIPVVELPYEAVHNFGVQTSAQDREGLFDNEFSGFMNSVRDRKQIVIDAIAQLS